MQGFDKMLVNVIGDVMMSAGVVAYLGAFTVSNSKLLSCTIDLNDMMS